MQLISADARPQATLDASEHGFVRACAAGVTTHQLAQWLDAMTGSSDRTD